MSGLANGKQSGCRCAPVLGLNTVMVSPLSMFPRLVTARRPLMVRVLYRRNIGARAVLSLLAWNMWFGDVTHSGMLWARRVWIRLEEARACIITPELMKLVVLPVRPFPMQKALRTRWVGRLGLKPRELKPHYLVLTLGLEETR